MIPNRKVFSVYFAEPQTPVVDVWDTLVSFLKAERSLPARFHLSQIAGHRQNARSERDLILDADGVRRTIIDRNLYAFSVSSGRGVSSVRYRLLPAGESNAESVLTATIEDKSKSPNDWGKLIEGLLVQWNGIVGRQWSVAYAGWQNATAPESYEVLFGPIPPGTRRVLVPSDGDSPCSELLDISRNPGRFRELIPGVHFSVSAEMWLGPEFWKYSSCTKSDLIRDDLFLEKRESPHFLYLKSWPVPFTRPDGEQGRVQQKLWQLLFHEDCEWPPGFGGISEEAVYGPTELLQMDSSSS